jgi:hypothetical protein
METSKAHPHIDNPTEEQLREAVSDRPPLIRELYLDLHRLICETLPDVNFSVDLKDGEIGYGKRQYGYDGWGMAALAPYTKWVTLHFLRGVDLEDRSGLLGGSGKSLRHVKVHSPEQLDAIAGEIRRLVAEAARLNEA